jgi:hypothetical protein
MSVSANQTNRDFTGFKRLLMRRIGSGQLTSDAVMQMALNAADAQMTGKATVDITSLSSDGSSANGELVMSTNDVLSICMDILDVINPVDITAPRKLFTRTDFSRQRGPFDYNSMTWP